MVNGHRKALRGCLQYEATEKRSLLYDGVWRECKYKAISVESDATKFSDRGSTPLAYTISRRHF